MAATNYTYSVNSDTASSQVDATALQSEVQSAAITIAVDHIAITGDILNIWMKAAISAGEKTTLDGVVAAHTGAPLAGNEAQLVEFSSSAKSNDNRPLVVSSVIGKDWNVAFNGRADDITNGHRWKGSHFTNVSTSIGTAVVEWQFTEIVCMAGGRFEYKGAIVGDWYTYEIYAPASTGQSSNPGSGAYAKLAVGGGLNMFVPAGTPGAGAADWDLDLTGTLNANVEINKMTPVPAAAGDGFFDCALNTSTGAWDMTYNAAKTGKYNLFDAAIPLVVYLPYVQMLGNDSENCIIPGAYMSKCVLPHWKHKLTLNNSTAKTLEVVWLLFLGRMTTAWNG